MNTETFKYNNNYNNNMEDTLKNTECSKCKYSWESKSDMKIVNCPSCRKPTKNKNKLGENYYG